MFPQTRVRSLENLPDREFQLLDVNLVGAKIDPPDLYRIEGLSALKAIHLPGPMWNARAGARKNHSVELGRLAAIDSLEEITFSYTFLARIKFDDDGITAIAPLENLKKLRIRRAQITGESLGPLRNLVWLDLTFSPISDKAMEAVGSMRKLQKLWLKDTRVTDEGVAHLAGVAELRELDLNGLGLSDDGVRHLATLAEMRKLELSGSRIGDDSARVFAEMPRLELLNLYGTRLTNAGLQQLESLEDLRELDLRYSSVTAAGVERFRRARPECHVNFVDQTVPTSGQRISSFMGGTDAELASWVRSAGGAAELADGRLVKVSLAGSSIGDEQVGALAGASSLRHLDLSTTEVSDLGVGLLAGHRSLEQLDLSENSVSDNSLETVGTFHSLRTLKLEHTLIEGAGLKHLAELYELEELQFAGLARAYGWN